MDIHQTKSYSLDRLQKTALSLMTVLILVTFVGANLQAVLWQSSQWLVSTVLPATVVDLTNKERSELSQTPLQRNAILDTAATQKAKHMAKNEYFSHFSPDGVSPWYWFDQAGYVYAHAGENLAIHFTDSTQVVEAWMNSPTHRENIVNGKYTEIGVGTAKGTYEGYDTVYVVQLFGAPGIAPAPVAQRPIEPPIAVAQTVPEVSVAENAPVVASETNSAEIIPPAPSVTLNPPSEVSVPTELAGAQETFSGTPEAVPESVNEPQDTAVQSAPEFVEPEARGHEQEIVVIESPVISTSSGLAIAQITVDNPSHAGATAVASMATKPNIVLQFVYFGLGLFVFLLLTASLVLEARQLRLVQVAYSVLLLFGMGGLWFLHSLLTSGAVII